MDKDDKNVALSLAFLLLATKRHFQGEGLDEDDAIEQAFDYAGRVIDKAKDELPSPKREQ